MKLDQLRDALRCEHETCLIDLSYDAMSAANAAVAKSLMISDVARIAKIEVRLREYLLAKWNVRAKQAVARALDIMAAHGKLPTTTLTASHAVDVIMRQFSRDVKPRVELEVANIYKLARKAGAAKARGKTKASLYYTLIGIDKPVRKAKGKDKKDKSKTKPDSWTLADEGAIEDLQDDSMVWIGRHYDENLRDAMRTTIGETVSRGLGRAEAGKKLAEVLATVAVPNGFHGTASQYFEGLAANITTNARVRGQLRSFNGIGVEVYEIVNPMDDRTCEVCSALNGTTFKVTDGVAQMDRAAAAKTPDEVKRAHPWLSATKIKGIINSSGKKGLVSHGLALPPYHFKCRCTIDVSFESYDFDKLAPADGD